MIKKKYLARKLSIPRTKLVVVHLAENIKTCHDKLSVTGNKDNGK